MGSVRWIACDLDGTLLGFEGGRHFVAPEAFAAVKEAVRRGAEFSVATGRSYRDVLGVLALDAEVKALTRWVVSCNGSVVYDAKNGEIVRTVRVADEDSRYTLGLVERLRAQGHLPVIGAYRPDGNLAMDAQGATNERFLDFCRHYHGDFSELSITPCAKVMDEKNVVKYVVFFPPWNPGGPAAGLRAASAADEKREGTISSDFAIEFNPKGVSKGEALAWLAPLAGQSLESTLAIGDSGNDATMLRAARYSVCPMSSADSVKACAKTVIDAPASLIVKAAIEAHLGLLGK